VTLEIADLSMAYPGQALPAVRGLSLAVGAGTMTALLGPSGSGKTTVMKLVAGLLAPDAGDIRLGGRSILALPPDRRGAVMVLQNAPLFPHLTLSQNVGFGLRMRGMSPARIAVEVAAMLEQVQLSGLEHRRPHQLSGGQAQRGALARALVLKPDLLLLDEPLTNLDAGLRDEMRGLIRSLQRHSGVTTLVVTHDQAEAVALGDRIALMLDGAIAQEGTPEALYARPVSIKVARFFGGVNFVPGLAGPEVFECALGKVRLPAGLPKGPGTLTIRPEALRLGPAAGAIPAVVNRITFLGSQSRVELSAAGQPLQALVSPEAARAMTIGQVVGVTLPARELWVVPD
jgi:ABC-type Fe3+/spermidine/putrescine transport system ATPase subunit